ncbi:ADP-ribosylglycohydrolase family protein [Streptomyces sp. NBC_00237]|uniref:ADP-ribosylglycohydrolase family protein n=1 Tax=Streptomyces sp. NBC_00237 TaxID=2975687 RepID=UPI00224E1653|nr:ADP-ribosylglycohydrolase family protein [Streptomyces sp. NBC_00237]MCX5202302.1 ADP-ribosylglycohydrolase family protein [Streptomyces sp. NBC_00237]
MRGGGWDPGPATEFNGALRPCLGSALWALRTTTTVEDALREAIDLGGDTDTVAALTGTLAGAAYGASALPARWTDPLHAPSRASATGSPTPPDLRRLALARWQHAPCGGAGRCRCAGPPGHDQSARTNPPYP